MRRLSVLGIAAFVVASDATLVAAWLGQIARSVATGPAMAGQAVPAYAAGHAIGAPNEARYC